MDVVFNFAYSEENRPTYYYLWKWMFALVLYVSTTAILCVLFFIVFGADRTMPTSKPVDCMVSNEPPADAEGLLA